METNQELLRTVSDLINNHENFICKNELSHAYITHAFTIISITETLIKSGETAALEKLHKFKKKTREKLIIALTDENLFHLTLDFVQGKMTAKEFKKLFK